MVPAARCLPPIVSGEPLPRPACGRESQVQAPRPQNQNQTEPRDFFLCLEASMASLPPDELCHRCRCAGADAGRERGNAMSPCRDPCRSLVGGMWGVKLAGVQISRREQLGLFKWDKKSKSLPKVRITIKQATWTSVARTDMRSLPRGGVPPRKHGLSLLTPARKRQPSLSALRRSQKGKSHVGNVRKAG